MVVWRLMFGGVTHFFEAFEGSGAKRAVLQVLAGMVYLMGFVCADPARAARQTAAGDLAGIYEFEPISQQRQGGGRVQGTATYRERMALPASAVFEAVLEDVSRADAAAEVIARTRIEHPGYPPIRFEIIYEPAKIEQNHDYSVRARITEGDRIVFTTMQSYLVLTHGNGNKVRLLLLRSAAPPPASSAPSESPLSVLPATFVGVLPCADCPGIRYQVNLFPDHTFVSRMTYEERNLSLAHNGHWQLTSKGKMLVLQGEDQAQEKFTVRDVRTLRKLDLEGREIESKLNYDLKRTPEFEPIEAQSLTTATALLENTYWKLTSLGDVPITPVLQQKPHFVLDSETHRVSGSGGCNQLTGSYELKNDHLTFSQMATTMMACAEGMDTEKAFLKVLTEAKTWKMAGGELELLNAAGNVIARFEARDSNNLSLLTGWDLTETWQPQPCLHQKAAAKPELLAWSGATYTVFQPHQAFPEPCSTKRNPISR